MSKTAGHAVTMSADTPPAPARWQGSDFPSLLGSLGTAIGARLNAGEALLAEVRGVL